MSLEKELQEEQVSQLDLSSFCKTESGTLLRQALDTLRQHDSNVCLVLKDGNLHGIVTDRDILRKGIAFPDLWDKPIDEIMTPNPVSVLPTTTAANALRLMDENHFRNLPVVDENGRVLGNLTHKSFIDYLTGLYPVELLNLPADPEDFPDAAAGG